MPHTNGAYVVWETPVGGFSPGDIYLYEVATGRGKKITGAVAGESGYHFPTIGQDYVTFISLDFDHVPLYHLRDGTTETLANGGGRTYTIGHYIAWVGDTVTEKQDWYLLWADLSLPNTADATPGSLPCTPSALPVEPSAAPATPVTSPSPAAAAGDVSSWPTYQDTEQRYRLRYPAGATIATDQYGRTTFTLTENQTTYTVRVQVGEMKPYAEAPPFRPAMILETLHQSIGLFDFREPEELTINGVDAALIAYSCCWTDAQPEPCSTRRGQAAAFLLGEQLYTLTFTVTGPDQCDATAVRWFEQMLHSFEPY